MVSVKRAQKPLAELSSNLLPPAKEQKKAGHNIEPTAQPSETLVPFDHPALEHHAEAHTPQDTAPTTTFFNLFWGDSILDQIGRASCRERV